MSYRYVLALVLMIIVNLPLSAASIDLQPSTLSPAVGTTFTVQVRLLSGPDSLTTSRVRLEFNPSMLQLISAAKDVAANNAIPSDVDVVSSSNNFSNFYQENTYLSVASSGTLHLLTFKALSAGQSSLTLKSYPGDQNGCLLTDSLNQIIPSVAGPTVINVGGTGVNTAPTANAGVDRTVTINTALSLFGAASDDGLPLPSGLTYQWSTTSGPANANFSNSGSLSPTVTFNTVGTYVLRLTADDGQLSGFDELTVDVTDALPPSVVTDLQCILSGPVPESATSVRIKTGGTTKLAALNPSTGPDRVWTGNVTTPVGITVVVIEFVAPDSSIKSRSFIIQR